MSGIFGIFNRDGRPVRKETVDGMLDAMSYWGPDDKGTWIDGNVALGHAMLWNTPESKFEHLPTREDHLVITMDARLDNREELASQVDLPDRPVAEIPDSDFILAAYRKWGEECPKYLLGDFAFAIWDEEKEQLFCARDHVGIKSFYYYIDDDEFMFANDIRSISANTYISKNINDEAVAIYLTVGELWHPTMTFFSSIVKLPPAAWMIVDAEKIVTTNYWKAEDSPQIRFDTFEEYSKKLRELLEDAVKKRLRSDYPIASHLSGGLDSSTIATVAARALHLKNKRLHVFNWVSAPKKEDDYEYYEWANSRRVAELERMEHHYTDLNAEDLSEILTHHNIVMNDTVDLWYEFKVRKEAKKNRVRSMLSGWGGDELITYGRDTYFSDIFRKYKFVTAIKELYLEVKNRRNAWRSFSSRFYYLILVPFVPVWLRCFLPKIKCDQRNYLKYISSSFLQQIRDIPIRTTKFTMRSVYTDQLALFNQGHLVCRLESWAASGFLDKIEYSYPLLDKRIVEFALGIPEKMYRQEGKKRYLFRYAISGLLPEDILWGNYKQELYRTQLLFSIEKKAFNLWKREFFKNKIMSKKKYIDYELLEKEIELLDLKEKLSLEERFKLIDNIEKSILVLKLEK